MKKDLALYLIEILHQTTTAGHSSFAVSCCILSKFYIKPQLEIALPLRTAGCILSKFYIKPQQKTRRGILNFRCILSKFYIKPQLVRNYYGYSQVVSYRNSTSNHNQAREVIESLRLYLIEILHQTTTRSSLISSLLMLYLIEILHQTTTPVMAILYLRCCILSKFYIKPQRLARVLFTLIVVSYRNSTSNHNIRGGMSRAAGVVSYRNSTSNHNWFRVESVKIVVVSYRNSTSNHNMRRITT